MSEYPHLTNAPITEALVDINANFSPNIDLELLEKMTNETETKTEYPDKKTRFSWSGSFKIDPKKMPRLQETKGGPDGYILTSKDKLNMLQVRLNGFSFHRLKPYKNWNEFHGNAKRLWKKYAAITSPDIITRIAIRYVNRIEVPGDKLNLKDYLKTAPDVASDLPQDISSFLVRIVIPFSKMSANAIISVTKDKYEEINNITPLIFDIDVYKERDIDPSSDEIWQHLRDLRNIKNEIFFKSITSKTMEIVK